MQKENNLTRLRERRGMTQREVAEELDVSRQAVSQWERSAAFPSMEKQLALSRLYGVPLEALYHGDVAEKEEVPPQEPKTKQQTRKIAAIFLAGYLCIVIGIILWGRLTNAPSMASNYLICVTLISILVWLVYFFYSLFQFIRRLVKK